ncbi:hypothetical protein LTR53_008982, partial [Teratosphaeriaceae sp. CCFEE 6253]
RRTFQRTAMAMEQRPSASTLGVSYNVTRLRSSTPSLPVHTQAPYSYTIPEPAAATHRKPELCPPHWLLRGTRPLRAKLKDLVLRVPAAETTTTRRVSVPTRPPLMRMKDSDDYLTARAANPWTGLVSPSIGSSSPPCTPSTPGEALSSRTKAASAPPPGSPTPSSAARARPALSRANEGRKVSAGSVRKWRAQVTGWISETAVASPRQTDATAGAGLLVSRAQPCLPEDRFVVPMPSAREPRPYAYPGCTDAEIRASDHYKRKTRKVSSEGYPGRSGGGSHDVVFGAQKPTDLKVVKTRQAMASGATYGYPAATAGAELTAATFAPSASPHTPCKRHKDVEPPVLRTVRGQATVRDAHAQGEQGPAIRRKPVFPSRSCSLGCEQDAGSGAYQTKPPGSGTPVPPSAYQLFRPTEADASFKRHLTKPASLERDSTSELLVAAAAYVLRACKSVRLPDPAILAALRSANATPRQKVDAMRALLTLAAQVVTFLMVWSMIWRLGAAVVQVLELVLWPFLVPFRVLRWMAGGA